MRRTILALALIRSGSCAARADHVQLGLRVPDGFEVSEYAGSELANDIFCMTIDGRGRVVVSGRGYTRVLADDGKTSDETTYKAGDVVDLTDDEAAELAAIGAIEADPVATPKKA